MKIVHSFWTRRATDAGGFEVFKCHWGDVRFLWYSWTLSAFKARESYDSLELITDSAGAQQLVDWLELPYTDVRMSLETIDVNPAFWAFGKIIACGEQDSEFFHIDGDVYLWKRLPKPFEAAGIVCQSFETHPWFTGFDFIYDRPRELMESTLKWIPACWKYTRDKIACNTAIFGGQDLEALNAFARTVTQLMQSDCNKLPGTILSRERMSGYMNCVLEQQMLYCVMKERGDLIVPLLFQVDIEISRSASQIGYTHMAGGKDGKSAKYLKKLRERVEREYPIQFERIEKRFHES